MNKQRITMIAIFLLWIGLVAYFHNQSKTLSPRVLKLSYEQSNVLIETEKPLTELLLKKVESLPGVEKIHLFSSINRPFFKKFYRVTTSVLNTQIIKQIKLAVPVVYTEYPMQIKGYSLAVNVNSLNPKEPQSNDIYSNHQWGLANKGQGVYQDLYEGRQVLLKGQHLEDSTYNGRDDIGYQYILDRNSDTDPGNDFKLKKDIIVAVADSGLDIEHDDINIYDEENQLNLGNLALNQQRDPVTGELVEGGFNECNSKGLPIALGNGSQVADSDQNGYPGDCIGWNFLAPDGDKDQRLVIDKTGHGTHVSGIIGAIRNNSKGIGGFSNQIKILPIKVLKEARPSGNGRPPRGLRVDALSDVGYIDRVSLGIEYAIKRGASVINMSFGWPAQAITSEETPDGEIRSISEMIKAAHASGLTLVAAVGNNNHNTPIFPCAFEEVICVGAMDIDGKVSSFSNFGSHVDIMAPGQRIISLVPKTLDADLLSVGRIGFDLALINGTSQAAPFVTGTVALLKGYFPNISNDEIRARLYLGAKSIDSTGKNYGHGLVRIDGAFETKAQPFIQPILKGNNYIKVTQDNNGALQALFPLKIKNYWKPNVSPIKLKLSTINEDLQLQQSEYQIPPLNEGQTFEIQVIARVRSLDSDSNFKLKMELEGFGSFERNFVLSNGISSEGLKELVYPIHASEFVMKNITRVLNDPRLKSVRIPLFTVQDDRYELESPEYYLVETTPEGQLYHILRVENEQILEKGTFLIPNAAGEIIFVKRDIDGDGKKDYYVSSIINRKNEDKKDTFDKFIGYSFFNENFEPVFGAHNTFLLTHRKSNIPNIENTVFLSRPFEKGSQHRLPVFVATGYVGERTPPEFRLTKKLSELKKYEIKQTFKDLPQDINKDWFDGDFDGFKKRVYYYEPVLIDGTYEIHERAFSNYFLDEKVRQALSPYYNLCKDVPELGIQSPENCRHFNFNDEIDVIRIMPQSPDQIRKNEMSVLFSVLEDSYTNCHNSLIKRCGTKYDYFLLTFTGADLATKNFRITKVDITKDLFNKDEGGSNTTTNFSKKGLSPAHIIDGDSVSFSGALSAFAITKQDQEYSNSFFGPEEQGFVLKNIFKQPNPLDSIIQHVSSFIDNGTPISLLRTASYLYVISREKWNDSKDPNKLSVVVSDFLPGHFYAQALKEIVTKDRSGTTRPAIYVDGSDTHGSRLFSWMIADGKLLAPIRLNLNFSQACESMNPVRLGEESDFAYATICPQADGGAAIKYYKLSP